MTAAAASQYRYARNGQSCMQFYGTSTYKEVYAVMPLMTGYDPDTMIYDDDCDFVIIGYANNIKKGTAKVTVRGVNSYSGTKTVSFKIGSKRFIWW